MANPPLPSTTLNPTGLADGSIGQDAEHNRRLALVAAKTRSLVIASDTNGRITWVNSAFEEKSGYSLEELRGKKPGAILRGPETDVATLIGIRDKIRKGESVPAIDTLHYTKSGEKYWVSVNIEPVRNAEGVFEGFVAVMTDITARKKMEKELATLNQNLEQLVSERTEKLRKSEAMFRRVVELSRAGIFQTDRNGLCTSVNEFWVTLTGIENDSAPGTNWTDILAPLDRERITRTWHKCVASNQTLEDKFRIRRPDGSSFWVRGRIGPEENSTGEITGFVGTLVDIDEVIQLATQQSNREQYLKTVLENLAEAVITIDKMGIIGSVNPSVKRIFGYDPEELIGQNVSMLTGGVHTAQHDQYLKNFHDTGTPRILGVNARQLEARKKDGSELPIELTVVKLDEPVGGQHYIGVVRDVSERIHREDQLRELQRMEVVSQLSGGVAHDFNNLLGIIVGSLDLVIPDLEDRPAEIALLEKALGAAERGGRLTQRLLSFSRQQALMPQRVDINQLFDDLSPLLRSLIDSSITIDMNLSVSCRSCKIDPGQLESAIVNLALNAQDAMPDGGILSVETLDTRLDHDEIPDRQETISGDYVLISVTDNGCGMSPDTLEHCFEPFYTSKERNEATGLGLSMVHGFVSQSGGNIRIVSEIGAGTTVRIYLPGFVEAEDQAELEQGDKSPPEQVDPGRRGR